MMICKLAPIVLFVYSRLEHVKSTIEALLNNDLAEYSDLLVYSDGAKSDSDWANVQLVREYFHSVTGFKSVTVIERPENLGLAANIIDGVSTVTAKYGKAIVLEDDIVTSPQFLNFMNYALDFYQDKKSVWHISGWNYPIDPTSLGDAFLWRGMNCWGWATWQDRWQHFAKNPARLVSEWTPTQKQRFDLENSGVFWSQVEDNYSGKRNTWAIFWYATIFERNGLCLNPSVSYVHNVGHDGSGENCGTVDVYAGNLQSKDKTPELPTVYEESTIALSRIKAFYKGLQRPLLVRVINKISRSVLGKNII